MSKQKLEIFFVVMIIVVILGAFLMWKFSPANLAREAAMSNMQGLMPH